MSRTRRWTAVGIVGVLALALGGLLWRNLNTAAPTTSTTLVALDPTTTEPEKTTSTTLAPTTTTDRVAEVEAILEDLWFGWFDAIYRRDPDALWAVVATSSTYDAGLRAMDQLSYESAPTRDALTVEIRKILLDRDDCLVVDNAVSLPFLVGDPSDSGVNVLWPHSERGMRFATAWLYAGDLWLADCDELVRDVTP